MYANSVTDQGGICVAAFGPPTREDHVRNRFRRPDGACGSGQFAASALDMLSVARNRDRWCGVRVVIRSPVSNASLKCLQTAIQVRMLEIMHQNNAFAMFLNPTARVPVAIQPRARRNCQITSDRSPSLASWRQHSCRGRCAVLEWIDGNVRLPKATLAVLISISNSEPLESQGLKVVCVQCFFRNYFRHS